MNSRKRFSKGVTYVIPYLNPSSSLRSDFFVTKSFFFFLKKEKSSEEITAGNTALLHS